MPALNRSLPARDKLTRHNFNYQRADFPIPEWKSLACAAVRRIEELSKPCWPRTLIPHEGEMKHGSLIARAGDEHWA
jgi:hypothetical protein